MGRCVTDISFQVLHCSICNLLCKVFNELICSLKHTVTMSQAVMGLGPGDALNLSAHVGIGGCSKVSEHTAVAGVSLRKWPLWEKELLGAKWYWDFWKLFWVAIPVVCWFWSNWKFGRKGTCGSSTIHLYQTAPWLYLQRISKRFQFAYPTVSVTSWVTKRQNCRQMPKTFLQAQFTVYTFQAGLQGYLTGLPNM